jgi:hypothetical protein
MLSFLLCFAALGQDGIMTGEPYKNWCGAHTHLEKMKTTDSELTSALMLLDKESTEYEIAARKITIPVVVHVVWNDSSEIISIEEIQKQIQGLSTDFNGDNWDTEKVPSAFEKLVSNTRISFKLATVAPNGKPTDGITYTKTYQPYFLMDGNYIKYTDSGGVDAWNTKKYLNVWIGRMGDVRGYAQFPGGDSKTDGVVVDYTDIGTYATELDSDGNEQEIIARVLSHEVGHWMGLYHIWGDSFCGDDGIKDTPTQMQPHWSCGDIETCGSNDLVNNYMDYIGFECMVMFTNDQRKKMWKTLVLFRKNLLTRANHKLIK